MTAPFPEPVETPNVKARATRARLNPAQRTLGEYRP